MTTTTLTRTTPRIYVACLAAYNSGRLHGEWIDLDGIDIDALNDRINAMLARSPEPNVTRRKCLDCGRHFDAGFNSAKRDDCPRCGSGNLSGIFASAEEWAVHDHEGFCGAIRSEWPDLRELVEVGAFLADADDQERAAFEWLLRERSFTAGEALARYDDVILWANDSHNPKRDYAREWLEELGELDDLNPLIADNINWDGVAADLEGLEEIDLSGFSGLVVNADDF